MEGLKTFGYDTCEKSEALEFALKSVDETGSFEGYASVFDKVDLQNDIVVAGAFRRTIDRKSGRFPLLWQHDQREPIGTIVKAEEDAKGLRIEGQLILEVPRATATRALVKAGVLSGMSIGYKTVKEGWDEPRKARLLKEINLMEVSIVTFPANPHAGVRKIKSLEGFKLEELLAMKNGLALASAAFLRKPGFEKYFPPESERASIKSFLEQLWQGQDRSAPWLGEDDYESLVASLEAVRFAELPSSKEEGQENSNAEASFFWPDSEEEPDKSADSSREFLEIWK